MSFTEEQKIAFRKQRLLIPLRPNRLTQGPQGIEPVSFSDVSPNNLNPNFNSRVDEPIEGLPSPTNFPRLPRT